MTHEFNLDLKALKACLPAMCKEETRYYLCGVHIKEKDGNILYEATNGHIMVRVESEVHNEDFEFIGLDIIVPDFLVKLLCKKSFTKNFGLEGDYIPCHVDGTRINVEMLDGLVNCKLIDGTFPEVEKVIPKTSAITFNKINLNAKYVDALAKSIQVFSGSPLIKMQFTGDRYGSPILIQNESVENWLAVLMPATLFDAES